MPITYADPVFEYSDTVPEGEVIRTDPEPGLIGPDTVVTLYVSLGPAPAGVGVPTTIRVTYASPKIHIGFG